MRSAGLPWKGWSGPHGRIRGAHAARFRGYDSCGLARHVATDTVKQLAVSIFGGEPADALELLRVAAKQVLGLALPALSSPPASLESWCSRLSRDSLRRSRDSSRSKKPVLALAHLVFALALLLVACLLLLELLGIGVLLEAKDLFLGAEDRLLLDGLCLLLGVSDESGSPQSLPAGELSVCVLVGEEPGREGRRRRARLGRGGCIKDFHVLPPG